MRISDCSSDVCSSDLRLALSLSGSGKVVLAGKAAQARVTVLGAGNVDAHGLTVADADVTMAGAGDVTLSATRRGTVQAEGAGNVTIGRSPACAVEGRGPGVVRCGTRRHLARQADHCSKAQKREQATNVGTNRTQKDRQKQPDQ